MQRCSYCNKPDPTVDRHLFDGMCSSCTNRALDDPSVSRQAEENNKKLTTQY
ncbi:hypothetical protein SP15_184A [Bacillus phage SP-15]|uniref:Uncharacterized protein n=1 Tax=Bacillus phage SP-15 TaxID=1792032 RepID=A0A127AWL9_9CAUD|nr:hypothetical protein SP15_184A [Bacillus phage SP-15]AMM44983.1 hypothetical protein SP15_184A [Bacillus phage SP-15]